MKVIENKKLDFDDVLIKPKPTELSSRSEVNINVSYICKHSQSIIIGVPVIVANMSCIATIPMAKSLCSYNFFVALHKFIHADLLVDFFNTDDSRCSFYTLGMSDDEFEKLKYVSKKCNIKKICLDTANGYMYSFLDKIKMLRESYPRSIILAGNVATPEGVENIIKAGADIVKCGIANGSFCDTKNKAGVGCKQFSVAAECGQAANDLNALCCSDGGCRSPADICKSLGAGSHFVMVGSMFAGYKQCESEWQCDNDGNVKKMLMYGMSSKVANEKYCGGLKDYRASEGKEGWVDYKGDVEILVLDIRGSLASCCTYTNTKNLENLWKNCEFYV